MGVVGRMLNVLISFQYPFSYPLKNFKTDSQIKGVSAAEAKLGAYGHPPTAGSEASSTERKSHPNIPPSVPAQDRKPEHGPVTVKQAWGKKSRASAFPSLAHLRVGKPWAWPLLESTEPPAPPPPRDSRRDTAHSDAPDLATSDTRRHF